MRVIWHNKYDFSLIQKEGRVLEDSLFSGISSSYIVQENSDTEVREALRAEECRLRTLEIDLSLKNQDIKVREPRPAIEAYYKLAFLLRSLKYLFNSYTNVAMSNLAFLEPIIWPQSMVLRNVKAEMLLTDQDKTNFLGKIENDKKSHSTHDFDRRKADHIRTFAESIAEMATSGTQSLELHCLTKADYDAINKHLKGMQLPSTMYIIACLDNEQGVVQEQTMWPTAKDSVPVKKWQPRFANIESPKSSRAPIVDTGKYMEDAIHRTGKTKAELEVAVNIEASVQQAQEVQAQQEIIVEQQVEKQVGVQYNTTARLHEPQNKAIDQYSRISVVKFTPRFDEILGIPTAITEQARDQQALTVGTDNTWDPSILTMESKEKAQKLYNQSQRVPKDQEKHVEKINFITYPLIASIFEEYCRSLPATDQTFTTLQQRIYELNKKGERLDLMAEIKAISASSDKIQAAAGKKAYSYIAHQYVRFMSGLTGAAPVQFEVLGNDDEIAGISWQTLIHKHTLEKGLNSWSITEEALRLVCNHYELFKGGLDYNNLPLGFRLHTYTVQGKDYKGKPSELNRMQTVQNHNNFEALQSGWNMQARYIGGPPEHGNPAVSICSLTWSIQQYAQDKKAHGHDKWRIDPMIAMRSDDPFMQQYLIKHYQTLNAHKPKYSRMGNTYDPYLDPDVRRDHGRPAVILEAMKIQGGNLLEQYINYHRGLQDTLPSRPLVEVLCDKLPTNNLPKDPKQIREVIEGMCSNPKTQRNILSMVTIHGMESIAGLVSYLLAIKQYNTDVYRALINCISSNNSRPDWSYLATPEVLDTFAQLADNLKTIAEAYQKAQAESGGDQRKEVDINAQKLLLKMQFLEAVLNSSSGPAAGVSAKSSHTGTTDIQTAMAVFEHFWSRFEAMVPNKDVMLIFRLQEELLNRVVSTLEVDGKKRRYIILDGVSGNAQVDLYRLYRILDHAAVNGVDMLQQQIIALNAEPEYQKTLKETSHNPNTIAQHLAYLNVPTNNMPVNWHPMRCSLNQHGAVYAMDLARTEISPADRLFAAALWDPIIITPEMNLTPGAGMNWYTGGYGYLKPPDVGHLNYYYNGTAGQKGLYEGPAWRALYGGTLNSNDAKLISAEEIIWHRTWYYKIIASFKPEYLDSVLEFFLEYSIARNFAIIHHGKDTLDLAESKEECESFLNALVRLSYTKEFTGQNMKLLLQGVKENIRDNTQMTRYKQRIQRAKYLVENGSNEHDLFYIISPSLPQDVVTRCTKIWKASKRANDKTRAVFAGFAQYQQANEISIQYPNSISWVGQGVESNGSDIFANTLGDQHKNQELLALCVLCDDSLPKDPREWKRDLSTFDSGKSNKEALEQHTALATMEAVNLWLDEIDWALVPNFQQKPYAELCAALKGKTTYEKCSEAMVDLFPGLMKRSDLISAKTSWGKLLASDPAIRITGENYKTWTVSQHYASCQEKEKYVSEHFDKETEIRDILTSAAITIDKMTTLETEKQRIALVILRHYLLCFLPHQAIRGEDGQLKKLGDDAKNYVENMLGELVRGDPYGFARNNTVEVINAKIRAKLTTLVRLQSLGLQKNMQNVDQIKNAYDSDSQNAEGIEFLWQIIRAMTIKQSFKKEDRELSAKNLLNKLTDTAHIWTTPSMFIGRSGKDQKQRYNHKLYKNDFRLFLSEVMKFATFAQEIKGYNFSELIQASFNLYQIQDLHRYDTYEASSSNSSSSSFSSSTVLEKQSATSIQLKLFRVLERVCRQQDKMLLIKYVAAFTIPKDAQNIQESSAGLKCFMELLEIAPDLIMNLVFAVDRRLGKNQKQPAPKFMVELTNKMLWMGPEQRLKSLRILDQILRNKFDNPDKAAANTLKKEKLATNDLPILNAFLEKMARLQGEQLAMLEKLVTPPICHSIKLKEDLLLKDVKELTIEYLRDKSSAFFQTAGNNLVFGWSNNKDIELRIQEDIAILKQQVGKILIRKAVDSDPKPLNPEVIERLVDSYKESEVASLQQKLAAIELDPSAMATVIESTVEENEATFRQQLEAMRVEKKADQSWQNLDSGTIETLVRYWREIIDTVRTEIIKLSDDDFIKGLNKAVEACQGDGLKQAQNIAKVFAYIAVARYRTTGEFPRPIQLISELSAKMDINKNFIHGLKTGSGKTLVIGISDTFDALLGAKVITTTSTYDLASRDALSQRKFYSYLGLESANTPITPLSTTMQEFKKYNIHYGTLSDVTLWRLNQLAQGERFLDDKGTPIRIRLKADEIDRDAHSPVKQRLAKREEASKSSAVWEKLLYLIVDMVDQEKSEKDSTKLLYAPYAEKDQKRFPAAQNHNNLLVFLKRKLTILDAEILANPDPKRKIELEDEYSLLIEAQSMLCTMEDSSPKNELKNAAAGKIDREAIHALIEAAIDSKAAMEKWKPGIDYYDVPEYSWNDQGRNPSIAVQYRKVSIVNGAFNKASRSIIYGKGMQQCYHLRANIAEKQKKQQDPGYQARHFVIEPLSDTIAMSTSQEELIGINSLKDSKELENFGYETTEGFTASMGNDDDELEFIAHQGFTLVKYPTHKEWRIKELFEGLQVPIHQSAGSSQKNEHLLLVESVDEQVQTLIQIALAINKETLGDTGRAQPLNLLCDTEAEVRTLFKKLNEYINRDTTGKLRQLFPAIQTYSKGTVQEFGEDGQLFLYDGKNYKDAWKNLHSQDEEHNEQKSTNKEKDLHEKVVKQMTQLGVITIGTTGTMARGTDAKAVPVFNKDGSSVMKDDKPVTTNLTTIMLSAKNMNPSDNVQGPGRTHGRFEEGRAGFILIKQDVADGLNENEQSKPPTQRTQYESSAIIALHVEELAQRNADRNRQAREKSRLADQIWRFLQYTTFRISAKLSDQSSSKENQETPKDYGQMIHLLSFVNRRLHVKLSDYFQNHPKATKEQASTDVFAMWKGLVDQAIETLSNKEQQELLSGIEEGLKVHVKSRATSARSVYKNVSKKDKSNFFRAFTVPYYTIDLISNTIFQGITSLFTYEIAKKKHAAIVGNRVIFMLCMSSTMMFVPPILTSALEQASIQLSVKTLPTPLSAKVLGEFHYQTLLVYMSIGMLLGATFGGILQSSSKHNAQNELRELVGAHTTLFSGIGSGAAAGGMYALQQYILQYGAEVLISKYISSSILASPEVTLVIMLTTHLFSGILSTIEYSFINEAINRSMDISSAYSGTNVSLIERSTL
ncbi:MAG: hypothetical protein JSS50_02635 [Proteobacteria bacterium]|nr:hypothetical protein [Pseudomonadota bacterium]